MRRRVSRRIIIVCVSNIASGNWLVRERRVVRTSRFFPLGEKKKESLEEIDVSRARRVTSSATVVRWVVSRSRNDAVDGRR